MSSVTRVIGMQLGGFIHQLSKLFIHRHQGLMFGFMIVAAHAAPQVAMAGAGDLDPTFGDGGKVTTTFMGPASARAADVKIACQSNGRIVAAGSASHSQGSDFALARYFADGTLDGSFGDGGTVMLDIGYFDTAEAVAILHDDSILVAGNSISDTFTFFDAVLVRLLPDGTLDSAFGNGGVVIADMGTSFDQMTSMAIQDDGRILVGTSTPFGMARFNADGTLDGSFGSGGIVTSNIGFTTGPTNVVVQADGRIIVSTAVYQDNSLFDFALLRYLDDGTLDSSFGIGGVATADFGMTWDYAFSLALQEDGRIVVAGVGGFDFIIAVARYTADGTLDADFGTGGRVTTNLAGFSEEATTVAVQPDGRIIVGGYSSVLGAANNFTILRYQIDGTLDGSFGAGGVASTDFNGSGINSIALQSDGGIVAAGILFNASSEFLVARYDSNGALDQGFGTGGYLTTPFSGPARANGYAITAVASQSDYKLVVAGGTLTTAGTQFALARYNIDGSLDNSFGDGGMVTTGSSHTAYGVAVQPDGKIVAAGQSYSSSTGGDLSLARYNTDGTLDSTFGNGGLADADFGLTYDSGTDIAVGADGRIVVAGTTWQPATGYDVAVACFNADGTLDNSFAVGGLVTEDFGGYESAIAVMFQADGRIVVACHVASNEDNFALVRYNVGGTLDTSFGNGGKVVSPFGIAADAAIQSDGRIVVVGTYFDWSTFGYDFAAARYNADGTLDTSFGDNGVAISDLGATYDFAEGVALQPDGAIVVVGSTQPGTTFDNDFAIVRYDSNGMLDENFGNGGLVTTHFDSTGGKAYGAIIQPDGRIVAAGTSYINFASVFVLARYDGGVTNQQPVAICNGDITTECTSSAGASVTLDGSASFDPDIDDVLLYHWDVSDLNVALDDTESATPTGTFPIGVTMATLTVVDQQGGVSTCDVTITVQDTTPPAVMVTTNVASLWPPNHAMHTVQIIVHATDVCAEPGEILPIIVTITSDEPDNLTGPSDGETTGDVNGADGNFVPVIVTNLLTYDTNLQAFVGTVQLRAERWSDGDGRKYTIDVIAFDHENNFNATSCCVVVPHDRRNN